MAMKFKGILHDFLHHVRGDQSPKQSPKPLPTTPDVEELEPLDAQRYLSPQSAQRSQRRRQRQEGATRSQHFPPPMLNRSASAPRTSRQQQLMPPRPGDAFSSGGTPILTPSNRPQQTRGVHGGPKPRNDFSNGYSGKAVSRSLSGRGADYDHNFSVSKRRKIGKEGDGYEFEPIMEKQSKSHLSPVQPDATQGLGLDQAKMRQVRHEYQGPTVPIVVADIDAEKGVLGGRKRRRSGQKSHLITDSQHGSSTSSPDPLAAGAGPVGSYDTVQHVPRPPEELHWRRRYLDKGNGFHLKLFSYKGLKISSPGLQLIPQKSGTTFKVEKDGLDTQATLRLKQLRTCFFHKDSRMVLFELVPSTSEPVERMALEFDEMKDRGAFWEDVDEKFLDKWKAFSSKDELEQAVLHEFESAYTPDSGLIGNRHSPPTQTPSHKETLSQDDEKEHRKLKNRLQGSAHGSNDYRAGEIDRTIESTNQHASDAAVPSRRSTRTTRSQINPNITLAEDNETTLNPVVLESEKFSMKHGLGPKWDHQLIYPKTGKNRATVCFEDLKKLDEGEELNDNLVNFRLRTLEERLKATDPEAAKRVYWFNTYFYATLIASRYDGVKNWTRNIDIFSFEYIVVPILESQHWYLTIICNLSALNRHPPVFLDILSPRTGATLVAAEDQTGTASAIIPRNNAIKGGIHENTPTTDSAEPEGALDLNSSSNLRAENATTNGIEKTIMNQDGQEPMAISGNIVEQGQELLLQGKGVQVISDSQSTENSLIAGKITSPLDLPPSPPHEKSIDEIFSNFQSDSASDHQGQESRPATSDSVRESRLQNMLQDLAQYSESSNPQIHNLNDSKYAVPEADEIHLLEDSAKSTLAAQRPGRTAARKTPRTTHQARRDADAPAIITLDSLGSAHPRTIRVLKNYLVAEAKDKRGGMKVNVRDIRGHTADGIPQQNNSVDCGLYLLGYAEKFVNDPKQFVTQILQKSLDAQRDWPKLNADDMRNELRKSVFQQYEEQEGTSVRAKDGEHVAEGQQSAINLLSDSAGKKADLSETKSQYDTPSFMDEIPGSRPEALVTAQPLDNEGTIQPLTNGQPTTTEVEQDATVTELAEQEPYQILDASPSRASLIRIEIPEYDDSAQSQIILDTPKKPRRAVSPVESEVGPAKRPKPDTPARPKSRGKHLPRRSNDDTRRSSRSSVKPTLNEPIDLDGD